MISPMPFDFWGDSTCSGCWRKNSSRTAGAYSCSHIVLLTNTEPTTPAPNKTHPITHSKNRIILLHPFCSNLIEMITESYYSTFLLYRSCLFPHRKMETRNVSDADYSAPHASPTYPNRTTRWICLLVQFFLKVSRSDTFRCYTLVMEQSRRRQQHLTHEIVERKFVFGVVEFLLPMPTQ